MDLYYGKNSGNSARSLLCLEEAKIPYTPRLLDPKQGDNRAPAYLGVNPMGKIPAFVDGELVLWESNAINWYLAETHPAAGLLPETPAARAAVQRWMFFQAAHVSPAMRPLFLFKNERMRSYWNFPADAASMEAAAKELARYLDVLETTFAADGREWLEGRFSLADIAYVPHAFLVCETDFDWSRWPRTRAWLERLFTRPAWIRVRDLVFG